MLVTLKEILKESIERKYAVAGFDAMEYCMADAIITAAEKKKLPVILMVPDMIMEQSNIEELMAFFKMRSVRASVPVCLHLDHGTSYEHAARAIRMGCTSVMFDGSHLPFEENVAMTSKIVGMAHACGVSVEAEIGCVDTPEGALEGAAANESMYTVPEDAVKFREMTDVDALAVAIGTVHGVYKGTPKLDLERLSKIREGIDIPLVMHGGSGLSDEAFRQAVEHGINKINYFTGLSLAMSDAAYRCLKEKEGRMHFPEMLGKVTDGAVELICSVMDVFGTQPLKL